MAGRHLAPIVLLSLVLGAACGTGDVGGEPPLDVATAPAGDAASDEIADAGADVVVAELPTADRTGDVTPCECGTAADCPPLEGPCAGVSICEDCRCDVRRVDFVPCDPSDPCAADGACIGGACVGHGAVSCDDGDPCTEDFCVPGEGCASGPLYGACDDGNACSAGDSCLLGTCEGALGPDCACDSDGDCAGFDDGDACTGLVRCLDGLCRVDPATVPACPTGDLVDCRVFTCDPSTGACVLAAAADGAGCDDGDPCTTGDLCLEGACTGAPGACPCGADADCAPWDDGDPCTGVLECHEARCRTAPGSAPDCGGVPAGACQLPVCDPVTGDCAALPAPDGLACDDGDPCTVSDSCQDGACASGDALGCDDGEPCTDDSCDPALGCVHAPSTAPCEDGNHCTAQDVCADGACGGGAAVWCDDGDPCTADSCQPAAGCVHVAAPGPCDDGSPCTVGDACQDGACLSGPNLCQCATDADCAWLDDGDLCTGSMICVDDACVIDGGAAVACPPSGSSCLVTACDPATGACVSTPAMEGTPCTDGDLCTLVDVCQGGACLGGSPWTCDDGDPCTQDQCDPAAGCTSSPIPNCGLGCGDGDCNGAETCGTCPADCGACPAVCGDGDCNGAETCDTCPADCGACPTVCGDGACEGAETCGSCPADCGACVQVCGDGDCNGSETVLSCHADCAPSWMNSAAPSGFHGAAFMDDATSCGACHGATLTGGVKSCETCHGGWKTDCTFCHGGMANQTGAPPWDLQGMASSGAVGAHTVHVTATAKSGALGCSLCHAMPANALTPGHIDGDGQAEVVLSDCAGGTYDPASGSCSSVYCHGNGSTTSTGGSATWTGGALGCQSCHTDGGLGGKHALHLGFGFNCSSCHNLNGATLAAPATHADCTKDVKAAVGYDPAAKTCSTAGCHGTKTW